MTTNSGKNIKIPKRYANKSKKIVPKNAQTGHKIHPIKNKTTSSQKEEDKEEKKEETPEKATEETKDEGSNTKPKSRKVKIVKNDKKSQKPEKKPDVKKENTKKLKPKTTGSSSQQEYNFRGNYDEDSSLFRYPLEEKELKQKCAQRLVEVQGQVDDDDLSTLLDRLIDIQADVHSKLVDKKRQLEDPKPDDFDIKQRLEWTIMEKLVSDIKIKWAKSSVDENRQNWEHVNDVFQKMHKRMDDKYFFKMIDLQIDKSKRKPDVPTGIWKTGKQRTKNLTYQEAPKRELNRFRKSLKPKKVIDEEEIENKFKNYNNQIWDPHDPNLYF